MASNNHQQDNNGTGLSMLTLDQFLQESIPTPSKDDSAVVFQPVSMNWDRGRWTSRNRDGRAPSGRGRGHHDIKGGTSRRPPTQGRRYGVLGSPQSSQDGVQAGVLMTHNPPNRQPLTKKSGNSVHRPMESVLTVGSHEAQLIKEKASGNMEHEAEVDLEALLTNAVPEHEVSFVLNQNLGVESGQQYHFMPVQELEDVKRNTVLKLLSGLLNAGVRGVIYMGVSENGLVEGITAEPQLISQFVEGLMKTVKFYLMPKLHTPQYGVRYTNVSTSSGQTLNNLWVVELHAVPQMQHYYNPIMDMTYHVRHGADIKSLPFNAFCDTVVAEASKTYEPEIQRVQERIKHLQDALDAKGVDTSKLATPHVCNLCWFNDCPTQCYGRSLVDEENTVIG